MSASQSPRAPVTHDTGSLINLDDGRDGPAVYEDLELPSPRDPSRPYVVLNMVSSVDGVSSMGGKASGIGGAADRLAMRALRSCVDAVMVGAGTLRAEKINLGLDDPGSRQPLAVIVAGDGQLPVQDNLIRPPNSSQRVLIFRPGSMPPDDKEQAKDRDTNVVTTVGVPTEGNGWADLRFCLELLRFGYGVNRLLVEGGPSLNSALIANDLADELFLTLSPKLMHTHPTQISHPALSGPQDLDLLSYYEQNGEIFLRYAL